MYVVYWDSQLVLVLGIVYKQVGAAYSPVFLGYSVCMMVTQGFYNVVISAAALVIYSAARTAIAYMTQNVWVIQMLYCNYCTSPHDTFGSV
jgi:hypothetical protein